MTIRMLRRLILLLALADMLGACGGTPGSPAGADVPAAKATRTYQDLVVGFAQIGAESEWRTANTRSIQETASISASS